MENRFANGHLGERVRRTGGGSSRVPVRMRLAVGSGDPGGEGLPPRYSESKRVKK